MSRGLRRVVVVIAALAALASCGRNHAPMTACLDGKPAVERVIDVAPPNCDPVLPGSAAPAAPAG